MCWYTIMQKESITRQIHFSSYSTSTFATLIVYVFTPIALVTGGLYAIKIIEVACNDDIVIGRLRCLYRIFAVSMGSVCLWCGEMNGDQLKFILHL